MNKKILTAEDFINQYSNQHPDEPKSLRDYFIEFAKLHVQEALKAVKTNINVDIDEFGNVTGYDDKMHKSILDSYPPSNIK